mmetsp:Transcript_106401/g.204716  ORF Transcript_106401/g.204716 Transcript_106401/m.204716 type:complete len:224 (-) Transcript_106401:53-724(-)
MPGKRRGKQRQTAAHDVLRSTFGKAQDVEAGFVSQDHKAHGRKCNLGRLLLALALALMGLLLLMVLFRSDFFALVSHKASPADLEKVRHNSSSEEMTLTQMHREPNQQGVAPTGDSRIHGPPPEETGDQSTDEQSEVIPPEGDSPEEDHEDPPTDPPMDAEHLPADKLPKDDLLSEVIPPEDSLDEPEREGDAARAVNELTGSVHGDHADEKHLEDEPPPGMD